MKVHCYQEIISTCFQELLYIISASWIKYVYHWQEFLLRIYSLSIEWAFSFVIFAYINRARSNYFSSVMANASFPSVPFWKGNVVFAQDFKENLPNHVGDDIDLWNVKKFVVTNDTFIYRSTTWQLPRFGQYHIFLDQSSSKYLDYSMKLETAMICEKFRSTAGRIPHVEISYILVLELNKSLKQHLKIAVL